LGRAIARVLADDHGRIVVGHDMRESSRPIVDALAAGITARGVDVIDIGLISTDGLYFASGALGVPGAMVTASHNPPRYNGLKLCRAGAVPVAIDSGLAEIRDLAAAGLDAVDGRRGEVVSRDVVDDFAAHVRSFVDRDLLGEVEVGIDAGNGMAGHIVPRVVEGLPVTVVPLYFELDGTFPNHPANPIEPANLVDLQRLVRDRGLPLGLAFDGDADRMFAVDETGRPVPSSLIGAVVARRLLARSPGATVLYNLICSRIVPETVESAGGTAVRTRVGHSFIKARMAETDAIFAAEHSGHYYFRDNYRADSGIIAALLLLEAVAEAGVPLSQVVAPYDVYASSGEINFVVDDVDEVTARVEAAFAPTARGTDRDDGLTVVLDDGWFNLRPSNTEPLLRLNAEGDDRAAMERIRDAVAATVAG
jgi:phosphomannomutase